MEGYEIGPVLVTGAGGFLGKHLVKKLTQHGILDQLTPSRKELDLLERQQIDAYLSAKKPKIIIHLAASVGGIGANRAKPGTFFYENLLMGVNLLESARVHNIEKVVIIGTICSYPKNTPVPFKESDLWNGYPEETNAPYGIAKKALLTMGQAYRSEYGMNIIHLMPVNLYGPGDNFDLETSHVIPAIMRKSIEAQENNQERVVLWGDGSPSREFIYVEDAAEAIVIATKRYDSEKPLNIGTGYEITIRELAEKISALVGFTGKILWDSTKPNGQPRRCLDTTSMKHALEYAPKTDIEQGLGKTLSWYRNERKKLSE